MTDFVQDGATDPKAAHAVPTPDPRVIAFEGLGYGLFLHWGLYSLRGEGEWVWHHHKLSREDYLPLKDRFDARDFDADALCAFACSVGFRYVCLTTRHHEGFSLYDTRGLNDWDAPHSPAGRDLVAEFSVACEKHGLKKFFYHTTLDWWHPDFDRDWDAYQRYLRDSVDILCSHYGTVDGLWFDGNWARRERDWQEDALYGLIRARQPEAIIVNNSSLGARGAEGHPETDVVTFEQGMPSARDQRGKARYRAGEMCETINSHWGVGADDLSHKSPGQIIERLAACRRFRANLLLNIGPTAGGALGAYESELVRLVGRWIGWCPQAVYDAVPAPELVARGRDFCLRAPGRVFYACHNVPIEGNRHLLGGEPGDGLHTIAGPLGLVSRVAWADNGEELGFSQDGERLVFTATPFPYGRVAAVRWAVLDSA